MQPLDASHALSRTARYHASLADVWAAVALLETHASWRTDLARMEPQPELRGHAVWREVPQRGEPVTYETVESLNERRLLRCVVDTDGPFGGCVTIELIRREDGALVTISERLKIKSSWFRYTNTVSGRRERLDTFLRDLGALLGESPRIADQPKELRDPPPTAADQPSATSAAPP